MFETQKSGNKTSSGEIDLNTKTHAIPKTGQNSKRHVLMHESPVYFPYYQKLSVSITK